MWPRGRGRNPGRGRGNMKPRGPYRGGGFRGSFRGGFPNKPRPYGKAQDRGPKRGDRPPFKKSLKGPIDRLSEQEVGITEYISDLPGFEGILKARYSDFQVNEIGLDGVVAKLTDMSCPKDVEEDDDCVVNRYRSLEQLPTETWDEMHKMVQSADKKEHVDIDVTSMSKEDRTKIHQAVKTVFGRKIIGSTVTKGDMKYITFKKFNKNNQSQWRSTWPDSREGKYVYFLVHKEFIDTIEANILISDCLRMRAANFCYAGVKDRRAKTTQWFCVRNVEPARIIEMTKSLKNIYLGNFCYKQDTLKLGQLKGNRFRIAIREVAAEDDLVEKGLVSLRDNGFINYYGMQRFGYCKEIPTHTIGVQLLKGNWSEAVNLILKPREHEQMRDVAEAKLVYHETRDIEKACSALRGNRNKCIEGKLLGGLYKHNVNDLVNALENVPRNMRLLYIHAYQSLVWNNMVSRRIKEFGLKPMVGDIVVPEDQESDTPWESVEADEADADAVSGKEQQIKVKILTESDLPNYTIYDIVMPLPGYDITYPDNVIKEWYKEYLEKDGLSLEMPKQKVKTYTLSGAYRKIVERVADMSWKFMKYNDSVDTLIRSDLEELRNYPEPKSVEDGKFKALIVDFCLPSSSYATMALRELMKINTTWNGQTDGKQSSEAKKNGKKETKSEETPEETPIKEEKKDSETAAEEKTEEYQPEDPTSETEDEVPEIKKEPEENVEDAQEDTNGEEKEIGDTIVKKEIDMESESVNMKRKIEDDESEDAKRLKE